MSASVHTPGPTRRGPEYCVDCYAVNGRVTVATRMFKDDALCERHYLALCKELEIEPDVTTLSEAKAAKEIAQPTPIKKIVFQARSAARRAVTSTSQRPDDSVAPAVEGLRDRAHSPTRPAPSKDSGVPQTPSAANPQPSNARKDITMPRSDTALRNDDGKRVCSCGCGTVLRSRHPYIEGHNINPAAGAAPAKRGRPRKPAQQSNGAPHTPGDHNGDGRRDVARHVSLSTSPNLPPVAITNNGNGNGNGHGKIASDGAYLVPCQVSEWAMDRIWLKLTPEEKAELLFRPPEAPQKEQQEPAHHA